MAKTTSFTYKVKPLEEGMRLDSLLAKRPEIASRSFAQRLIENGFVSVDEKKVGKSFRVLADQKIKYQMPEPEKAEVEPQNIPIRIVYEDNDLAVVDKPSGLVVHPSYGHWDNTLVNALLYHLKNLSTIGGVRRPGIVHRLDKDTSGLMLVGKNDEAHIVLSADIKERKVERKYFALVLGTFEENKFSIEAPIGRHPVDRKKMAVRAEGRYAKTDAKVLRRFEKYTLLEIKLVTGRTHQIRVHLSYISHPVAGDTVYGNVDANLGLKRPFLHAFSLHFKHPITRKDLNFKSELPKDLQTVLKKLAS